MTPARERKKRKSLNEIAQLHQTNEPSARPKQHFWKPLGKHVGAIWEAVGDHLGGIWELEAEDASGRHLESKSASPPK